MPNRRGTRKPTLVVYPCVWCIFGFVIGVCLCLVSFTAWQQSASRTSTVQVAVQRSRNPVDTQRILRHQEDGSQQIVSPTITATTAPEAAHGPREAVGTRAQPHAERPAAAAATQLAEPAAQQTAKCGALTKALLQKYAVANTVMITVNDIITVQSLGRHWLRNVNAANITNWLMVATDTATAAYLESLGVSRCFMLPGTEGRAKADTGYRWHDLPWIAATWRNTEAAAKVQALGFNVLYSDLDVMWLRDPLPYVMAFPDADFLISLDTVGTDGSKNPVDSHKESLENNIHIGKNFNTGIYFLRASQGGRALMLAWLGQKNATRSTQKALNMMLQARHAEKHAVQSPLNRDLLLVLGGAVAMGSLRATGFENSYTYFVAKLHEHHQQPPYSLHMVYLLGGFTSKVHHIREAQLAAEPPEYYSVPRLLSFSLQVPRVPAEFNGWPNAQHSHEEMIQKHLRLLDLQLAQAWHGFGAALALERTVVLPKLLCHCVRTWFAVSSCRFQGDFTTHLPYTCIGDHVWNLDELYAGNNTVGPHTLSVREHSFLDNPSYPAALKESVVVVAHQPGICPNQTEPCLKEAGTASGALLLHLSQPATSAQLAALLAPYQRFQRIHLAEPHRIFSKFDQVSEQRQYDALTSRLTVEWCCRRDEERGALLPSHKVLMRPFTRLAYTKLCEMSTRDKKKVQYWC